MRFSFLAVTMAAALVAAPVQAEWTDEQKAAAAGALVLLGAAALAHHEDHHEDGKHLTQVEEIAAFDRGYRDGLHNAERDPRDGGRNYTDGYEAGEQERQHRLAHRKQDNHVKHNLPNLAKRACVGEASARWGRNPRDIHVTNGRKVGGDDYLVEVSAGKRHGNCEANSKGDIYLFKKGRI
ncbi:hypothetical protein CLV78_107204 [Aliiruegeria haliotis]|uniref:Uncharacterized protein n=1 Tax=Aliiruegeria haliotis TaxID=1280846 RepID=A0A2T0RMC2_9RHOB|nr:hypothetical protein [Aliiruegeria haliotis]PRY22280.1 hypothetical protein CLV78_107204 [Aliiruegeria haliotis]